MKYRLVSVETFGGSKPKIFEEFVRQEQIALASNTAKSLRSGSGRHG